MRRLVVSVCVLNASSLAWAQQPPGAPSAVQLDAVTVYAPGETADGPVVGYRATRSASATRTDTSLHDTPQSVTVLPRDVVEDTAATRLIDVLDYAGGVGRVNNFGGQGLALFSTRGFTSGEFYRNGFPINRGYPTAPDASTIERLEVVRGPSAALYGRGDPGGTFNVVSKQPLSRPAVTVGSQLSDQGLRRATVDATGPLDTEGKLAYRLNAVAEGGKTFRDGADTERYGVSPVISWQLTEATRIIFEADLMRNNAPLDRGRTAYTTQQGRSSRSVNLWEMGNGNLLHSDNAMAQVRFDHAINDDWTLAGGVQWMDGSLKGNAVEANGLQGDGRTLGRNANYRRLDWTDRTVQLNLTGKVDTWGIRHTLFTGVEYDNYDYASIIQRSAAGATAYPIDIFNPAVGQPWPALTRTTTHDRESLNTWAAFVQDQISLTDKLKALVGVRLERFKHDYTDLSPAARSFAKSDTAVTPRFGLMYDVTPTVAVYANTARSYKPNTGAQRLGGGFDPEKGRSNEVGVKWEALDRTLSVNGALYHTVKQNVQTVDPVDSSYRIATGEVRSQGLDLNVVGNITPAWRVIAGYALVDAEVTKDNVAPAGTRLANIPRTMASLLNVYTFQEGPARGLGLGAGIKHTADRPASTGTGAYTMKRYTVVDLLAFYQVNRKLRVNLDVRNLFNKDYDEGAFQSYVYPGAPRTVQVGMAYTF